MLRSSSEPRQYFPALDGLRALAVLAVVWHHSTPRQLPGWIGRGHLGVQLFFCISGFLITTLLIDERNRTGELKLGHFWWRRALRILPLYYLVLGLFIAHAALLPDSSLRQHFFANLPAFASGTTTFFVSYGVPHPVLFGFSWSLATELQFYLVWPLLLVLSGTPRRALALLCAMLAADQLVGRGLLLPRGFAADVVTSFSASLGLGALLACALADPKLGPGFSWILRRRATLPLLSGIALWLIVSPLGPFLLFELVLAGLVAAAALADARVNASLTWSPLVRVGRLSYAIYLFHVPLIGGVKRLLPAFASEPLVVFPLALALSVALAELSARYVEAPLLCLRTPSARLTRLRPS